MGIKRMNIDHMTVPSGMDGTHPVYMSSVRRMNYCKKNKNLIKMAIYVLIVNIINCV